MPGLDGTGPMGAGPLTGRGLGPCGFGMRRGFGRGYGRRAWLGCGFGPGYARQLVLTKEEQKKILEAELKELEAEKKAILEELAALK